MDTTTLFEWDSVLITASEAIALMRKYRGKPLEIIFAYGGECYRMGVDAKNPREPFFMDDQTYPSMLAFCSSACIEGGFLLPDLQDKLEILAINREEPMQYLENYT